MIHLLIGSTGAGKTTYARALAKERNAIPFAIDDWMKTLFFPDLDDEISFDWAMARIERCEEQIWKTAEAVLAGGREVVLEISMSTRALREKQIARAERSGFAHRLHYLDVPCELRRRRVLQRNHERNDTFFFEVDEGMFDFVENMFEVPSDEELRGAVIVRHGEE